MVYGPDPHLWTRKELEHAERALKLYAKRPRSEQEHYLRVAGELQRLTQIHRLGPAGENAVLAALYHGVPLDTLRRYSRSLRTDVLRLVEDYQAMGKLSPKQMLSVPHLVTFFKQSLSDPRTFLIRTVDTYERLEHAQQYKIPASQHRQNAQALLHVFSRIAQAGNFQRLSGDIEELAFRSLAPDAYRRMQSAMRDYLPAEEMARMENEGLNLLEEAVKKAMPNALVLRRSEKALEPLRVGAPVVLLEVRRKSVWRTFRKLYRSEPNFWSMNWQTIGAEDMRRRIREYYKRRRPGEAVEEPGLKDLVAFRAVLPGPAWEKEGKRPKTAAEEEEQSRRSVRVLRQKLLDVISTRDQSKGKRLETRDYDLFPRAGYRSIHVRYRRPGTNWWFNFQLRDTAMHREAEYGQARHAAYKEEEGAFVLPRLQAALQIAHQGTLSLEPEERKNFVQAFYDALWRRFYVHKDIHGNPIVVPLSNDPSKPTNWLDATIHHYKSMRREDWWKVVGVKLGGEKVRMSTPVPDPQHLKDVAVEFIEDPHRTPHHSISRKVYDRLALPTSRDVLMKHWLRYPQSSPLHLAEEPRTLAPTAKRTTSKRKRKSHK